MNIEIVGKGYKADEKLTALLLKKLKRLDKYFGEGTHARLTLMQQHGEYMMEFTVAEGHNIRAEAKSMSMNDNIDKLIPKITRQFRKQHTGEIAKRGKKPPVKEETEEEA